MATSYVVLVIKAQNASAKTLKDKFFRGAGAKPGGRFGARQALTAISNLLVAIVAGTIRGSVFGSLIDDTGTKATSTIACVQASALANYVRWTFGAQTITLTEGTDFVRGASNATLGVNLKTAINAHQVLRQLFVATDNGTGTVTCTPKFPTSLMHNVTMSTDDAVAFVLTQATGGTAGAAQFFLRGFDTGNNP